MKTCTKCRETKEYDNFYNSCKNKDGFSTWCKSCQWDRKKLSKTDPISAMKAIIRGSIALENKILKPLGKKICCGCKEINNIDNFNGSYCYPCKRKREKQIRSSEIGKESKKKQDKKYYENNKDKISKLAKEYREKNKETIAIKKKEWCDKRKSEKKEYDRLYRLKKKLEKEQQILSSK